MCLGWRCGGGSPLRSTWEALDHFEAKLLPQPVSRLAAQSR